MAKVLTFCNQKGGVGKTTSCLNVGCAIANLGQKVLIIDMDPQGNATSGLGIDKNYLKLTTYDVMISRANPKEALHNTDIELLTIIPSNAQLTGAEIELVSAVGREFILRNAIASIGEDFDFVLLDCPPSLGLLTLNALTAADKLIIPLQCEYYALEGLGQLINTFNLIKANLNRGLEIGGVILTMADFRTNLTEQVIDEVKKFFGDKVFGSVVPRSVRLSEAPSYGKPALIYDPDGRGSKAYVDVAKELLAREGLGVSRLASEPVQSLAEGAVSGNT